MTMRIAMVMLLLAFGWTGLGLRAGESPEEAAQRRHMEESYGRLSGQVEDVLGAQAALQRRVNALEEQLQAARQDQERSKRGAVTRDDLRKIYEDIQKLDARREEDKKLILEEIKKLMKMPPPPAPTPEVAPSTQKAPVTAKDKPKPRKPRDTGEQDRDKDKDKDKGRDKDKQATEPAAQQKGYEYTVAERDTLDAIAAAYRKKGVKVTVDQIVKANPGLKPQRLVVGKTIFIPDPAAP